MMLAAAEEHAKRKLNVAKYSSFKSTDYVIAESLVYSSFKIISYAYRDCC